MATVPLQEIASVKCVEQRGADILEVKRSGVAGQNTTLQLLTNEVLTRVSTGLNSICPVPPPRSDSLSPGPFTLVFPRTRTSFGDIRLSAAGPRLCNTLPSTLRQMTS